MRSIGLCPTVVAADPQALADALRRADAGAWVVPAGLDPALATHLVRELQRGGGAPPLLGVEAPLAVGREVTARLCALDREEGRAAERGVAEAVTLAGEAGAPFVIVRLGETDPLAEAWPALRRRFLRGDLDAGRARVAMAERDLLAEAGLDRARAALDRLLRVAERRGVRLLLANPRRATELPSPVEVDTLGRDFAGAPLAPLLDLAAAHLPDVMGLLPLELTLASFGAAAPLWYVGDACGPIGALGPGRGQLELGALLPRCPAEAQWVFSPWRGLSLDEAVAAAAAFARY